MKKFALAAVIAAASLLIAPVLLLAPPAFASSDGCLWQQSGIFPDAAVTQPGSAVTVNGIVFTCSDGGSVTAPQYNWSVAGTTGGNETDPGLVNTLNGFSNSSYFSPGAALNVGDDAWVLGSNWSDVGSWGDFYDSFTGCGLCINPI